MTQLAMSHTTKTLFTVTTPRLRRSASVYARNENKRFSLDTTHPVYVMHVRARKGPRRRGADN